MAKQGKQLSAEERYYVATQWQLIGRKFRLHKLAVASAVLLVLFYLAALFADFFSPHATQTQHEQYICAPPQRVRLLHNGQWAGGPFVYDIQAKRHPETLRTVYVADTDDRHYLKLFARGHDYRLLGLIPTDIHLFGSDDGPVFLFGTDHLGRDMFSRNLHAARISLTIGLVGVALSFALGCVLGGVSGYFGGFVDTIIQRLIEFLLCIPTLPLWMGLSAALPKKWSPVATYFGITVILSIIGWCNLARVVRGKILSLRAEDFVVAARISGANDGRIIFKHLIPGFMSYLIVNVTLAIPGMILGETALSFLGLGMRAPAVSWGVLLKQVQNLRSLAQYPWLLLPGLFVVIVVLAFNFVGDGLRDAADPYK